MRKFLVVLDDSRECLNAMRFAAMRAAKSGGGVEILAVIPPEEFNHWIGVGAVMREEAREEAEAKMAIHADYVKKLTNGTPILYVREGDIRYELLELIYQEHEISLLVLGADTQSETAGPLITFLMACGASRCRVPITVVPGNLTDEQLDALF